MDGADLSFVNTTDYGSDGFVFHSYNLSQPYRPVLVSVYPTSVNQSLNVYVQFDEQPTADVYEYHVQVLTKLRHISSNMFFFSYLSTQFCKCYLLGFVAKVAWHFAGSIRKRLN